MRIVYLEPDQSLDPPAPFRMGAAGRAWIGENGRVESESRVVLSANATHAMLGHGVVDRLNSLELEGCLGSGRKVMISPLKFDAVLRVFYQADDKTYGEAFDFLAARQDGENGEEDTEFRVRIDNRDYQRALSRLQFLISSASREGSLAWIQI